VKKEQIMAKRIGVVLSGCGVSDGSEIQEAVSILVALDKRAAEAICMAPNIPQTATVNHLNHKQDPTPRDVLAESARIARGKIRDLANVHAADLDGLVFPGGFGAVRNLCSYAVEGPRCRVIPEVARVILEMHAAGKPIAFACIAPVLAAAVLGARGHKPTLTVGTDAETADAIAAMGGRHETRGPTEVCIDRDNKLITTPCYMTASGPWEVFQGADRLVEELLKMA
jgi:enhancing lycopene biosynthesis protein 2